MALLGLRSADLEAIVAGPAAFWSGKETYYVQMQLPGAKGWQLRSRAEARR